MPFVFAVWHFLHPDFMAVASVCLGLVTLVLVGLVALRQLKIMDDQTAMMRDQGDTALKMKVMAENQEKVTVRQGEIAERQYQIMQDQLSRKAILDVRLFFDSMVGALGDKRVKVLIGIYNSGTRSPSDGLYWKIVIPEDVVSQSNLGWDEQGVAQSVVERVENCFCYENHLKEPVFPKRTTFIGWIELPPNVGSNPFVLSWGIVAEDGAFPSEEKDGEIEVTKTSLGELFRNAQGRIRRI